jgi:putative addiction module component (TIGR02574 family)
MLECLIRTKRVEDAFFGVEADLMTIREQVLQQALSLPPEDRAFVADQLDQSLPHSQFASQDIAAAWNAEIDRRIAAYERGDAQASIAEESIARMRRFLADYRAGKVNT